MVIYVTEDICERFGIVPADELRQPVRSMAETVLAREGADGLRYLTCSHCLQTPILFF